MFKFVKLTPEYAEKVEELERKLYPPRLRLGKRNIGENLKMAEEEKANFSVGFFSDNNLIGYLIAWPQETRAEGFSEQVILVDDMAILPEYKDRFYGILGAFVEEIHNLGYAGTAIEGMTRIAAYKMLKKHSRILMELGYEIRNEETFFDEDVDEELVWVRLLPL